MFGMPSDTPLHASILNETLPYGHFDDLNEDLRALCRRCRKVLKTEKKNLHYLIRRQQFAAYLILYAPWLHRFAYRIYNSRR
mgnify:CR=1 FL=1